MHTSLLRRIIITLMLAAVVSMIASPAAAAPSVDYDPAKLSNLAIANRLIDAVFNEEDAEVATALVSADAVIHTQHGDYSGPQGLLTYIASLKHIFPGAMFSVVDAEASGNNVTVDWLLTSTRIRMATTGDVASVDVELRGSTVIATDEGQIAGVTFDPSVAALPDTAADSPAYGRPF
jgi:predicted SnoaL-like aldol condensation-catalyzing enzyme